MILLNKKNSDLYFDYANFLIKKQKYSEAISIYNKALNFVEKKFHPKLNYSTIIKYLVATIIVFLTIYVLMSEFLIYEKEIFVFLPNFLPFLIGSGAGYLGLTYLIDPKTRKLAKLVFAEFRNKKQN